MEKYPVILAIMAVNLAVLKVSIRRQNIFLQRSCMIIVGAFVYAAIMLFIIKNETWWLRGTLFGDELEAFEQYRRFVNASQGLENKLADLLNRTFGSW